MALQLQMRRLGMGYNLDGEYNAKWEIWGETCRSKLPRDMMITYREMLRERKYDVRIINTKLEPENAL